MVGKIIRIISNTYIVKSNNGNIYECTARGKLKTEELKPVVGDNVEIEELSNNQAVIKNVLERTTSLKRPKVSNISQIIFVISPKMPKPNLFLLDKELALAEFLNLKSVIVINKIDLNTKDTDMLYDLYKSVRI